MTVYDSYLGLGTVLLFITYTTAKTMHLNMSFEGDTKVEMVKESVNVGDTVVLMCITDAIPIWKINSNYYYWRDVPDNHLFDFKNNTLTISIEQSLAAALSGCDNIILYQCIYGIFQSKKVPLRMPGK